MASFADAVRLQDQYNPKDYADNSPEAIKQREFMAPFLTESLRKISLGGSMESEFFREDPEEDEDEHQGGDDGMEESTYRLVDLSIWPLDSDGGGGCHCQRTVNEQDTLIGDRLENHIKYSLNLDPEMVDHDNEYDYRDKWSYMRALKYKDAGAEDVCSPSVLMGDMAIFIRIRFTPALVPVALCVIQMR